METQIAVVFSEPVDLASGAFSLGLVNNYGSGTNDGSADTALTGVLGTPTNPNGDGITWIIPIISNGTNSYALRGTHGGISGASLNNGVYQLNVTAADVTAATGGTPMAADYASPAWHRLFGDVDNSGRVFNTEYSAFLAAYGSTYVSSGSTNYSQDLDVDGDGRVFNTDYSAFEADFGSTKVYTEPLGPAPDLQVKYSPTSGAGYNRNIFLEFNLASISSIGQAVLRLNGDVTDSETVSIGAYAVANPSFGPSTITWNNQPAAGTLLATTSVSGTGDNWFQWDLTSYMQAQLAAGNTTVGIELSGLTSTTGYADFTSEQLVLDSGQVLDTHAGVNATQTSATTAALSALGSEQPPGNVAPGITASSGASYTYDPAADTLSLASGTLTFSQDVGSPQSLSLNVSADGPSSFLVFDSTQHLNSLTLTDGASATMALSGTDTVSGGALTSYGTTLAQANTAVLVLNSLSIPAAGASLGGGAVNTAQGTLDLTNNAMILNYTGAGATALAGADALVASGFNGDAWNGTGIISSEAQADAAGGNGYTAVGLADNAVTHFSNFAGQDVSSGSQVLFMYTYYGDANLDGQVTYADAQQYLSGLTSNPGGAAGTGWAYGNFDYSSTPGTAADVALYEAGAAGYAANGPINSPAGLLADSGAASLTYTWTATSVPSGASMPTFSDSGDNSAANAVATLTTPGDYTFEVSISDPQGETATGSVSLTVAAPVFTSVAVTPGTATVGLAGTQQFTATALDQFGGALATQPAFTWTNSGAGSVSSSGLYTAPASYGSDTVSAASGGVSSAAAVAVSAPAAPTALTSSVSGGGVTLSWTAPSEPVDTFNVYASVDGGDTFTLFDSVDGGQTSDSLAGLSPGTPYVFEVTAVQGTAESPPSNTTSLTSPALPDAPSGLTASVSGGSVTLSWTGDPTSLATSYNVYASTDGGTTFTQIDSVDASQTCDSLSGLTPNTAYVFQVTAVDASGETAPSNSTTAVTSPAVPASPSGLTASVSGGTVALNWTADSTALATSYNVYASTDGGTTFSLIDSVDASQTSDSLYGLAPDTSYVFQVTSVDASGESAPSNDTDSLTSPALPATPTGLTATMSAGDAVLNWTGDATLSTGYNIYESTDGGNTFTYLDSTAAGTTTYTATTDQLTAGTAYVFQVTATDASGETTASSNADFTAPAAPTNVAVTLSSEATSATVTWDPGDSLAEGYIVTRTPDNGSSGTVTVATIPGDATSLCTDSGLDPTQSYTYTVTPYYTSAPPASGDPTGTGVSASADTYTGNIEDFTVTSAPGSGSANLTWQYQGSDSFEIEEQDTGAAGTNYATVATTGGRSWEAGGLTVGDTYNFRIRADHSDGTASDYSTQSITLPGPTATITASNDADSATPNIALNFSADPSPSGDPVAFYNVQWYNNAAPGTGWVGLDLYPGSTTGVDVGVQALETASFRVQASYADGTLSAWSPTATATSGYGNDPPADPSTVTPVTVTATAASDTSVTLTYGATLPSYAIATANGTYTLAYSPDSAVCGTESTTQTLQTFTDSSGGGSTTITGLTPGVKYDFVVSVSWTTQGGNPSNETGGGGFGEASATTTGNTAPTAPAAITATLDPTADQIDVHWQNTSGNETGFQLLRSLDDGTTWAADGGILAADQTSTTDSFSSAMSSALSLGSLIYEVEAVQGNAASQPTSAPATQGVPTIVATNGTPLDGVTLKATHVGVAFSTKFKVLGADGKPTSKYKLAVSTSDPHIAVGVLDGTPVDNVYTAGFKFLRTTPANTPVQLILTASDGGGVTRATAAISVSVLNTNWTVKPAVTTLSRTGAGAPQTTTVTVTAKDDAGNPIPGIGVTALDPDTEQLGVASASPGVKGGFDVTGANGTATFTITAAPYSGPKPLASAGVLFKWGSGGGQDCGADADQTFTLKP